MKNIHVLPTDKPSRLIKSQDNDFIFLNTDAPNWFEINFKTTKQNIYITSDEKIKEGDWFLKANTNQPTKRIHLGNNIYKEDKKIILTTDQDLIKDGVQAIDDEFLEWFVKNPSCEIIDIETMMECEKCGKEHCDNLQCRGYKDIPYYKIIIPKEELKQETLENVMLQNGCHDRKSDNLWREGVKFGVEWQQEQIYNKIKKLYDNEEITGFSKRAYAQCLDIVEQFKNK